MIDTWREFYLHLMGVNIDYDTRTYDESDDDRIAKKNVMTKILTWKRWRNNEETVSEWNAVIIDSCMTYWWQFEKVIWQSYLIIFSLEQKKYYYWLFCAVHTTQNRFFLSHYTVNIYLLRKIKLFSIFKIMHTKKCPM
jgi:hypothetical protein